MNKHANILVTGYALAVAALCLSSGPAQGDAAGDKKRAQLQHVKRLLVVPAFFGTDTLGELPSSTKPAAGSPHKLVSDEKRKAELNEYVETLRKLEIHARERLPKRFAVRTPFDVINTDEVVKALSELKINGPDLFQNGGRINGKRFDAPNAAQVKQLADRLSADAVLVAVMDEPRRSNGSYYFDPLSGPGYNSPKVHDKVTFDLLLADGTAVLRDTIEVEHPLTRIVGRVFVEADWLETEDLIIEDFLDEVTRYTPRK